MAAAMVLLEPTRQPADQPVQPAHHQQRATAMGGLAAGLALLPALIKLYWLLAAGAVIVTILPVPVPQAFKCAAQCTRAIGEPSSLPAATLTAAPGWRAGMRWCSPRRAASCGRSSPTRSARSG